MSRFGFPALRGPPLRCQSVPLGEHMPDRTSEDIYTHALRRELMISVPSYHPPFLAFGPAGGVSQHSLTTVTSTCVDMFRIAALCTAMNSCYGKLNCNFLSLKPPLQASQRSDSLDNLFLVQQIVHVTLSNKIIYSCIGTGSVCAANASATGFRAERHELTCSSFTTVSFPLPFFCISESFLCRKVRSASTSWSSVVGTVRCRLYFFIA